MITGTDKVGHNGRMKVSKYGVRISRSTSHNDYISIYRKNDTTIDYEGDLSKINMDNTEYNFYVNLFLRNEILINLAQNDKYIKYIDQAFISDEKDRRNNGHIVIRNQENGNADVYDKNNNYLYTKNIKGERIKHA